MHQPRRLTFAARFGLALAIIVLSARFSPAKTITVTNGNDHGPGSLRAAIGHAAASDTVNFAAAVRAVTLTSGPLGISKALAIKGNGARNTIVRRSGAAGTAPFRLFNVSPVKATLSGLTIANGRGGDNGGCLYVAGSTLTLSGCAISNNKGRFGGAIYNDGGTVTIKGCTISDNSSMGESDGGGIYNFGTLTMSRSTLSRNHAYNAGAILNYGIATITNSTIAGNSASHSSGGIFNATGSESQPHIVHLRNTIVARNIDGNGFPDFYGDLHSLGYNLIGKTKGITAVSGNTTGNQTNVDPKLGPLQDNGGPTDTRALLSSPAIDKGDSGSASTDQRGKLRPVDHSGLPNANGGDGADIGAFEVQLDEIPTVRSTDLESEPESELSDH